MRISDILGVAACFTLTSALPTVNTVRSGQAVSVTFIGAAGAQYTIDVPLNSPATLTNNVLSISQIASSFDVKNHCTLITVDFPPVLVDLGPNLWNVGPPQTVISIACSGAPPPVKTISVEFDGAADAKYTLSVPLDGTVVPTNNVLSISNIKTDYSGLPSCKIVYVDFPAALVLTATNTWSVGPPQTVKSISCS